MAYRRTEGVEARLADNRNRILHAARTLIGEGGWPEAQVSHVAAAAGVATGTVYRYFPSKAHLEAIASGTEPPAQRLQSAVTAFVERAMRHRRLAYALIAEPCEPEIDQARLTYRHAISAQIVRIVRAGQETGDFHRAVDPAIAATVVVGGFMEALIGPLSPLNADFGPTGQQDAAAVRGLAGQIAALCCAALLYHPPEETHP
jgi:AcrR family transcriptional regulator